MPDIKYREDNLDRYIDTFGFDIYAGTRTDWNARHFERLSGVAQVATGNVPGWRQLLREGSLATGEMNVSVVCYRATPFFQSVEVIIPFNGVKVQSVQQYPGPAIPSGVPGLPDAELQQEVSDIAFQKILRRGIEIKRQWQAGASLGELPETLRFVEDNAKNIGNAFLRWDTSAQALRERYLRKAFTTYKNGKRGKFLDDPGKGLLNFQKDISDQWLNFSFGLQPLLHDIDDAESALQTMSVLESIARKTLKAKHTIRNITNVTAPSGVPVGLFWVQAGSETSVEATCKMFAFAHAQASGPRFTSTVLGFSPEDFVPTLWELTPYSWLVDYFANVGSIVEAWSWVDSVFGSKIQKTFHLKGVTERTQVRNRTEEWSAMQGLQYSGSVFSPGYHRREHKTISRTVVYPWTQIPSLRFKLPHNGSQYANIAALWASRAASSLQRMRRASEKLPYLQPSTATGKWRGGDR